MRSLRSRVIVLAGAGVFAAGAILSLLSRQALLALDANVRDARLSVATVTADAIARELTADMQTLEAIAMAPRLQTPEAAFARLRLATAVCYAPAGSPARCVPGDASLLLPGGGSSFLKQVDGADGHAIAVFDALGARVRPLLASNTTLAFSSEPLRDIAAPVAGTPWLVRHVTPDAEDPVITFRRRSLWLAPALAGLAVLLATGIGLSVNRPLAALTHAAEEIAGGNLSGPIAGGADEIGRLGSALEHMRLELLASRDAAARINEDLEHRVEARTAELQHLLRQIISAQEDERRRVARELHDETSQLLAAIGLALHGGRSGEPDLKELQNLVGRLHDGVHRLIVNLRPSMLDDLGLAAAIDATAESQLRRAGIRTRCELAELENTRLDPAIEISLFRIVQEAIFNVVRHSGATTVLIQAGRDAGHAWVEIEDDGCGFDQARLQLDNTTLRGVGLLGMRERAELIGARLEIESAPERGTRVKVSVAL